MAAVAALIRTAIERDGQERFAARCRLDRQAVYRITSGESRYVTLPLVDALVTRGLGDPSLLYTVPEFADAYCEGA